MMRTPPLPSIAEMYQAISNRDASYDGVFVTAVKTTGIFCRPTCPARKPKLESVEFFGAPREALLAGYRACKRCRPMDAIQRPPKWVSTLTTKIDRDPSRRIRSADLRAMAIDPARASQYFKTHYGMTFQAYHRARRLGVAMAAVRDGDAIERIGARCGFQSASGFRDAFAKAFGQPPSKSNGAACLLARWIDTPLGPMLAIASERGLCLLEFVDRRMLPTQLEILRRRFGAAIVPGNSPHLDQIADELSLYFEGELRRFNVPLDMRGSEFQLRVWRALMGIRFAATASYADIASDLNAPGAQRAVGKANGENRIAIVIPCHRVIRSDGLLCGYGGGLWRKQWLLDHEAAHARNVNGATESRRESALRSAASAATAAPPLHEA